MPGIFQNDVMSTGVISVYNPVSYGSGSYCYMDPETQQEMHDNQEYAIVLHNQDQAEALTLENTIKDFVSYVENGEEDHALEAYNDILVELQKQSNFDGLMREDGDDSMLRATAYKQIETYLCNRDNEQVDVEEWLEDETQNIKERDRQKGFTFKEDRVDETTTEDLVEALTGKEVYRNETTVAGHAWNAVCGFFPSVGRFIFGDKAHY